MKLLKDDELLPLVSGATPIIRDLPTPADWYGADSPLQAASVDLRIGRIFLPGAVLPASGSEAKPMFEYVMRSGQTAVVETLETLYLPDHIAAIGFPPSTVSFKGILMTNPGHVDPGFEGRLRFTLINMSRQDYVLRAGDAVVTLLLIELSGATQRRWGHMSAGNEAPPYTIQDNLDRLAPDFVDVERRATLIAEQAVQQAELHIKWRQVWVPIVVALITGLLSMTYTWFKPAWMEPMHKLETDVNTLKARLEIHTLERRLEVMEGQLRSLQAAPPVPPASPREGTTPPGARH